MKAQPLVVQKLWQLFKFSDACIKVKGLKKKRSNSHIHFGMDRKATPQEMYM